jgi:hypothetical protein
LNFRYTFFCALFCFTLCEAATADSSASSSDSDIRIGAYYGMNVTQPHGENSGVTIDGKQGYDIGLMTWIPLFPGYVNLRALASYKTAVKSYTDANLTPTTQFNVTETTIDGGLGLQFSLFWDFYLFAEGKLSLPTSDSTTIVTSGGTVAMNPANDGLQAYGLGYELFDFSDIYFSLEAEYDHGSEARPLGEVNSFLIGQIFISFGF